MQASEPPRSGRLGGIRLYLVGLALLVALPLAALTVFRITTLRAESRAEADREALRLARQVAARIDERVRTADALLLGLGAGLDRADLRAAYLDSALRVMLRNGSGRYANIFVADSTGTLVNSALTVPTAVAARGALADRNYFKLARESDQSIVAEPIRSRMVPDSAWIVVLARAFRDENRRFLGIVGVSIRLDSLSDVVSAENLASKPLVTIMDTSGTIITRSEEAPQYIGTRRYRPSANAQQSAGSVTRIRDFNGRFRVTAHARATAAPWIALTGILESEVNTAARRRLNNELLLFAFVAAIAVLIAWRTARGIAMPLTRLAEDARALMRGAVGHRAVEDGPREIRSLAAAFNQMSDTVERRNAALADSERRYRLLFDSNPLPMWAWDADTKQLLAVNEAAIEKYGHERDHFLSLEITDLIDPSEHHRFAASRLPFSEARQGAGTWKHRTADGRVIEMEVVTTSSRRLGRASWLSVGIDVTARRAAERALAASEEQLRQSQKMEAIGAFAGGIAHDFNNLLTGMLGYCDLALIGMEPHDPAYADVEEIRSLALRGADLTRQILTVSRKSVVQPAFIDPNEVVRGLDRLLRRVIGEHITLDVRLTDGIGTVHADTGQLEQVLLNLAANARDAMPNGGALEVRTRLVAPEEVAAESLEAGREWMAISVRDTGAGMAPDVMARIFEPFFTTKERGKGTGLGLALAYAMMEQAGGAIRAVSTVGEGSTFHLYLPRHQRATPRASAESGSQGGTTGTETILVAEDEESVRAVVVSALRSRGYQVIAAHDGESALAMARRHPGRIDLLLTDVVMPGMNGRELAETLERERPEMRVLFASGYTDDASLLQGIRTDELSFIQKPFSPADLSRRVRQLLGAAVRVG